jgi:hypothetical protein
MFSYYNLLILATSSKSPYRAQNIEPILGK